MAMIKIVGLEGHENKFAKIPNFPADNYNGLR